MKKISVLIISIVLFICLMLSSCSYPAHKKYYIIDNYANIWDLAGLNYALEDNITFFPQNPTKQVVVDFLCRYDQQLPLGEGIQIFLVVKYDDVLEFNRETERLSKMAYNATELFDTEYMVMATRILVDDAYEYAFIDSNEMNIKYIYIENLPKEEIEFEHIYLPKEYYRYSEQNEDNTSYLIVF